MKTKIIVLFLIGLVVAGIGYIVNRSICHRPEPFKRELKSIIPRPLSEKAIDEKGFRFEDRLRLSTLEISSEDAEKAIENTPGFLRIGSVSLSLPAAEIDTNAINMLMGVANKLDCPGAACTRSVLALRISYGVQSGNLILFYSPIKACSVSVGGAGGGGTNFVNYRNCKEGPGYVYNGGDEFSAPAPDAMSTATVAYATAQSGFRIRRKEASGVFDNFHPGNTFFDDATSVIFSFQQIKKLFSKKAGVTTVKLWNALGVFDIDPATRYPDPVLKHILLFSEAGVTYTGNDLKITAKPFSNLAHICPPDCNLYGFLTAPHLK